MSRHCVKGRAGEHWKEHVTQLAGSVPGALLNRPHILGAVKALEALKRRARANSTPCRITSRTGRHMDRGLEPAGLGDT